MRVCQSPLWRILVDMPEVHAVGGIDFCPRIIAPAGAASLRADSRKHDAFSLGHVARGITFETSSVPNRREDCRARSGITYDRVSAFIDGDAGHPAVQTIRAISPRLLLHGASREIAARHIKLIPANTCWLGAVCVLTNGARRPQRFCATKALIHHGRHDLIAQGIQVYPRSLLWHNGRLYS